MEQILKYRASWNPAQGHGAISIATTSGPKPPFNFKDPAEFTAVLTILATAEKAAITPDGLFVTGTEDVDGEQ